MSVTLAFQVSAEFLHINDLLKGAQISAHGKQKCPMLQIEKNWLKNNFISFGKISIYPFAFNNSRSEHEVKQVFFNTFMV